jgi:hypothetical protein
LNIKMAKSIKNLSTIISKCIARRFYIYIYIDVARSLLPMWL